MDITIIIRLLLAIAQVLPEIAQIVPIVEKMIGGQEVTAADAAAVQAAIRSLEKMVVAREQALLQDKS